MTKPQGEFARALVANWLQRRNGAPPRVPAPMTMGNTPSLPPAEIPSGSANDEPISLLKNLTLHTADPAHARVLQEAKAHLEAGRPEDARQLLLERDKSPRPAMSRDAWFLSAIAEAECGRYQASIDTLSQMTRVWPANTLVRDALRMVTAKKHQEGMWVRNMYFLDRANYMDYPKSVCIETTARCNAKCDFCPHENLERRDTAMDDGLFLKILEDLQGIPAHVKFRISPYFISEPFMDRKLFDRLDQINEKLPHAEIDINSNLNFLPKNFFTRIKQVKNLGMFRASIFSLDKKEYEDVYKIDHDRTMKNLLALLKFNAEEQVIKYPILVSRVLTGDEKDRAFVDGVDNMLKDFRKGKDYAVLTATPAQGVYDGQLSFGSCESRRIPFNEPCGNWFKLHITSTGDVALCCFDPEAKYSLGNAKTQNVLSIYNSGWFRSTRETAFSRETVYPCNKCDYGIKFAEVNYGERGLIGMLADNLAKKLLVF